MIPGSATPFLLAKSDGDYKIDRSLRFNSGDSSYLSRTPSSEGNRKTWTWSAWIKRAKIGTGQRVFTGTNSSSDDNWTAIHFANDKLYISGYNTHYRISNRVFRDPGAWFHLVVKYELGASAEADKIKAWCNGEEITWETSNTAPSTSGINTANNHTLGAEQSPNNGALNSYCDLYLAEVHFIDGQALAPTDFGESDATTGVWNPIKYSGSYGTHTAPTYDSTYGSDITSTEVVKTIDGDLSTYGVPTGDFVGYTYNASNEPFINIKWENTKSSSITVYIQPWVGGSAANSGTFDSSGGNSVTIAAGATLNTKFNFPSGYQGYFRVYTSGDGVYLRMYDTGGTREFNSFHLDFSDNSSNSALGTDSSDNNNNWTVNNLTANAINYISSTAGSLYSGSWSQAFNGSTSTPAPYIYSTTSSVTLSTAISGVIEVYTSLPGTYRGNPTVYTLSNNATYSKSTISAEWISFGNQSNVTSLSVNAPDPGAYIFAIRVDGSILVSESAGGTDSLIDTPTDYEGGSGNNGGNYCTWNPLDNAGTLANGNLDFSQASAAFTNVRSTFAVSSGKWYWEGTVQARGGAAYIGIGTSAASLTVNIGAANSFGYVNDGNKQSNNTASVSYGASYTTGDVIGVAFDADAGTLTFYKNGSSQGQAYSGLTSGPYFFMVTGYSGTTWNANFGQRPFAYTPPTGYKSLCTTNLPEPTIADGSTAMNVALYNGNNGTNAITGLGFSPDMLWLKSRNAATFPALANTVVGPNYFLRTNGTNAQSGPGYNDDIVSFDSDGFTLGADTYYAFCNRSPNTYVAWAWDAGSSNTSISAGGLNSSIYDQSQTWSGGSVTGATYSGVTWADAFDGAFGTGVFTYATNTSTLTMPSNTTWSNKFEVYALKYGGTLYVNGTDVGASMSGFTTTAQWHDITSIVGSSGTLSSIGVSDVSTNYVKLFAVRLDGKLLVDTGESVTNVPSIASTVRANPSAGFSIVEWTGTSANGTIGHGLNAAPEFIITKIPSNVSNWNCYHKGLTDATKYIWLNSTTAEATQTAAWNSTHPTSSVFHVGGEPEVNRNTFESIAYCFAPVEGYSSFGSYQGNGSSDGPMVYTGMRPRWLLIKRTDAANNSWRIYDTARDPYNQAGIELYPNDGSVEYNGFGIDFLSNGFKLRNSSYPNASGGTYIYAAFAEHPFKIARAR